MSTLRKPYLVGNRDLLWVLAAAAVCACFAWALLGHLQKRHEVYRLGYQMSALTLEHEMLLEENRRLVVEAALQADVDRLESEALLRLRLRPTEPSQIRHGSPR